MALLATGSPSPRALAGPLPRTAPLPAPRDSGQSPEPSLLRVVLADDQPLVRAGCRDALERAGLEVAAEVQDGAGALAAARTHRPDVVLLEVGMPGLDGPAAVRELRALPTPPRVLALTALDEDAQVQAMIRAGATGYLLKDATAEDLVHGVRAVARGHMLLAPSVTARLLARYTSPLSSLPSELAPREVEIVRSVARGLTNAEIGAALFLSEATVKTYVSRLLARLGLRDRLHLAVLAYETGLVRPGHADPPRL